MAKCNGRTCKREATEGFRSCKRCRDRDTKAGQRRPTTPDWIMRHYPPPPGWIRVDQMLAPKPCDQEDIALKENELRPLPQGRSDPRHAALPLVQGAGPQQNEQHDGL